MEAALQAGVERIVYTSSVATLAPADGRARRRKPAAGAPTTPSAPTRTARCWPSGWSRRWSSAMSCRRSSSIRRRRSARATSSRRRPAASSSRRRRGRMPAFVDTGLNLVHVDDVAHGHLAALERGRIGERYILGGDNVALSEMLADIAQMVGRRPPSRASAARARLSDRLRRRSRRAHVTGKAPFATRDGLRMARSTCSSPTPRRARTRLYLAAASSRASPTPSPGSARPECCRDRFAALLPPSRSPIWLMLLFAPRRVLARGERDDRLRRSADELARMTGGDRDRSRPRRGRRTSRACVAIAARGRIAGRLRRRAWSTTRAATAPPTSRARRRRRWAPRTLTVLRADDPPPGWTGKIKRCGWTRVRNALNADRGAPASHPRRSVGQGPAVRALPGLHPVHRRRHRGRRPTCWPAWSSGAERDDRC